MAFQSLHDKMEQLLALADVQINGSRPWDIQIHNEKFYSRVFANASLGLGEAYMEGWWDVEKLDEFFSRVLRAQLDEMVRPLYLLLPWLYGRFTNMQKPSRAFHVGQRHYDIGNALYETMLDRRMIYSCGFWQHAENLDEAQEAKLELVGQKLGLQPGMKVVDIGCGWGGTAKYLCERYDVEMVGITVSEQQAHHAEELCKGLPIEIRLQDYRDLEGIFDRALSIGMVEHVGPKNYKTFLHVVRTHLKDDGLFLLHTIGKNKGSWSFDPWIHRYIFPNSVLPSPAQITRAMEGEFVLEDWHNFGPDYDKTLLQWFSNFHQNWDTIKGQYPDRFYRMWKYYLLSCAGSFRARVNQVWQLVLSPRGVPDGYTCRVRELEPCLHG